MPTIIPKIRKPQKHKAYSPILAAKIKKNSKRKATRVHEIMPD
jgi:hypothetical protein